MMSAEIVEQLQLPQCEQLGFVVHDMAAALALYEYRISASLIGEHRVPQRSRIGVAFEMQGRRPLTEETLDAIRKLSDGDEQLVTTVKAATRLAFIERNPHRPERHAFRPRRRTKGNTDAVA